MTLIHNSSGFDPLNLSPWEFDQGSGGWREWDSKNSPTTLALLEEYLDRYAEGDLWVGETPKDTLGRYLPPRVLRWHAGQVSAFLSDLPRALQHMETCLSFETDPGFRAYIEGTLCFFRGNTTGLHYWTTKVEGPNQAVLHRLSDGLRRGFPYNRAY